MRVHAEPAGVSRVRRLHVCAHQGDVGGCKPDHGSAEGDGVLLHGAVVPGSRACRMCRLERQGPVLRPPVVTSAGR